MSESKINLRKKILKKRKAIDSTQKHKKELSLANKISEHTIYKQAKKIAIYYPLHDELSTMQAIRNACDDKKQVFLPIINYVHKRLLFAEYNENTKLKPNKYGIHEPEDKGKALGDLGIDCLILPAIAVDINGYRLGYGHGWYDKTLASCANEQLPYTIVVGYQECLLKTVYPEPHDIRADAIITV